MTSYPVLPAETLKHLPPHCGEIRARLTEALNSLNRKIVVLDDDPTGVQTVHDVYVYTRWDKEILTEAFRAPERMFFSLTNSRGLTAPESRAQQREIAENLAAVSAETGTDFILLSRGDSTLRGHWPMETEVLRETLESGGRKRFDGEVLYPFFREGGRYTLNDVHYVLQGEQLFPAGQTEFAKDKSFGYTASSLSEWCEEKSGGRFPAASCCHVSLEELRAGDVDGIAAKLKTVSDFGKITVDSADYEDVAVFTAALCEAIAAGKEFLFRCAAALPKVLGGVGDIPLLTREDLVDRDNGNGGIILVGSHVNKTTRQLEALRRSDRLHPQRPSGSPHSGQGSSAPDLYTDFGCADQRDRETPHPSLLHCGQGRHHFQRRGHQGPPGPQGSCERPDPTGHPGLADRGRESVSRPPLCDFPGQRRRGR